MMLMFFCTFLVFVYFTQLFITVVPSEHWCKLPNASGLPMEELRKLAIPRADLVPYEGHQLAYSRCWMYDLPMDQIIAAKQPDEGWPMKRCEDWEFKFSREDVPYSSIATEHLWVTWCI
ncbi:hypothetical protein KM043_001205 [Ampulex compressa]|nr:hypothetical protein KM043_001205 [Ampulex compressa]